MLLLDCVFVALDAFLVGVGLPYGLVLVTLPICFPSLFNIFIVSLPNAVGEPKNSESCC